MRASVTFSWLHVTDLHQGQREQALLLPRVQTAFERDLRKLHDQAGPFDLVLFTGDLTQRGAAEEFAALDKTLFTIWNCLEALGSHPVLLAVPGNHDLVRPAPSDPRLAELSRWAADPAIGEQFWSEPGSPSRALVGEAFANYASWWNDHRFPRVPGHRAGLAPGDFTVTVEKRGFALGVMGLNSAFLQLSAGVHTGKLDVGLQQFHAAAGGNGSRWAEGCHAALLLTHHPLSWLTPPARQTFDAEIAGHFTAHLFGHMHEPELGEQRLLGASSGYRWLQGRSLFGLETWGQSRSRSHGYSVGRLTVQGDKAASLQIWPRLLVNQKMVPDHAAAELDQAKGCAQETVALRQPFVHNAPNLKRQAALADPDAPFDRHWYVHRSGWEARALGYLDVLGKPATILGPKDIGKTWLCKYVCDSLRHRVSDPVRVAEVDVGTLVARTGANTSDSFLRELCVWVGGELKLARADVLGWWQTADGAPGERATRVFEDRLLPSPSPLVIAIDRLEAIPEAVRMDLFSLLRAWCDRNAQPPWDLLRLLLVIPRIPNLGDLQSPFTITRAIPIEAFSVDEAEELVSYYGLRANNRELAEAHRTLGGHPFWLRKAAHEARSQRTGLAEVIGDVVATIAEDYRQRLHRKPGWRDALTSLARDQDAAISAATLDELYDAGFIVRKESAPLEYEPRMVQPLLAALES